MKALKEFILPSSLLAGTIIGAGVFSLPYVFVKAGVGLSFVFLIVFGIVYFMVHLIYAEIVLKNGNNHRFAGLTKVYFGNFGYWLAVLMTIVEMFFVLTIYLILSSSFTKIIFQNLSDIYSAILFWLIGSLIVFAGTRRIAFFEMIAIFGILLAIVIVSWFGWSSFFDKSFNFASSDWKLWLLPFGALLFAINGRPAIATICHYFQKNNLSFKKIRKVIFWGTFVPVLLYGFFVIGVLGASSLITIDSIGGVVSSFKMPFFRILFAVLGLTALLSSYFTIGLDVFRSIEFDLNFPKKISGFLVFILPLLIYFLNLGSFIKLVEIAGGIFIGLEGILITAMWVKAKKDSKILPDSSLNFISWKLGFLKHFLYAVFGVSVVYVLLFEVFGL